MAKLIDQCEKYFGSRDFYEVLEIPKKSTDKQGKLNSNSGNFPT